MGSCGTKSDNEVTIPTNPRLQRAYQQYSQIIQITHPLNVNMKYNSLFTLIPDLYTGVGIKRTNQYESRLSREEWLQKQQEFWDSRTEGSKSNWLTIKAAVNADEETAKVLLNAADLKLINNSMQIIFDHQGMKYDVPVFCLNYPVSFPIKKSTEQGLIQSFEIKPIQFKARCSKWQKDMELDYKTNTSVQALKEAISAAHEAQKVRIFFNGKEMQDHHQIGHYGVKTDAVVQVFL